MKREKITIKKKVIDGYFHCDGDKTITHAVMIADSIYEYIICLQQLNPDKKITLESIITWKFMTVGEMDELKASEDYLNWKRTEPSAQQSNTTKEVK